MSGRLSLSESLFSYSVFSEQFSKPEITSILHVEHLPTPPQALKWGISFLNDAVKIVSSGEISIFLLSGCISILCFKDLCESSQNGGFLLFLQPQKKTSADLSHSNLKGIFFVFLWEPSQNGCLELFPQEHQ